MLLKADKLHVPERAPAPFPTLWPKNSVLSLSQKSELVMGMSLGVPSKRHQLGRC